MNPHHKNQKSFVKRNNHHAVAWLAMLACSAAMAQSVAPAQNQAGAGRGLINPLIDNLTVAKDAVMAKASKLTGVQDAPSGSMTANVQSESTHSAVTTPAVTGAADIKVQPAPQMKPLAANPVKAPAVDTEGAINPLSGKSFSEEQLQRVLNANKLVTEIGRQQVEQAKNLVELSKAAADSGQISAAKQRSDAINVTPKKPIRPVKVDESLGEGEQLIPKNFMGSVPAPMFGGSSGGLASGTVQIGQDSFTPQSRFDGQQPRVVYVDTQPAKTAQAATGFGFGASSVPAPQLGPLPGALPNQMPR